MYITYFYVNEEGAAMGLGLSCMADGTDPGPPTRGPTNTIYPPPRPSAYEIYAGESEVHDPIIPTSFFTIA